MDTPTSASSTFSDYCDTTREESPHARFAFVAVCALSMAAAFSSFATAGAVGESRQALHAMHTRLAQVSQASRATHLAASTGSYELCSDVQELLSPIFADGPSLAIR